MGIIKAAKLAFDYLRYGEEGEEPEVNRAIDHVDLDIEEGQFIAILGHNGSGKSTLAKHINGLLVPTEGTLWVDHMDTASDADIWNIRQKAGMVFQNPDNQIVATVVEEDCAFGLENLGVAPDEIRRRVDGALAAVGMRDHAEAAPHMLSGGQKQRVAIAGVLAMRPKIIVFDESTAMLDPSGRREVFAVAEELNRRDGITIVWITHFMDEALRAGRLLVMDAGKVALEGAPREVFQKTEEIRRMGLDVPPMAQLAAQLRADGVPLRADIMTVEEMAVELCRSKFGA